MTTTDDRNFEQPAVFFEVCGKQYPLLFSQVQYERQIQIESEYPGEVQSMAAMILSAIDQGDITKQDINFVDVLLAVDTMISSSDEETGQWLKIVNIRNEVPFYKNAIPLAGNFKTPFKGIMEKLKPPSVLIGGGIVWETASSKK